MIKAADESLHSETVRIMRCSSPSLGARYKTLSVALFLQHSPENNLDSDLDLLITKLDETLALYRKWDNQYRMKQVVALKLKVYEKYCDPRSKSQAVKECTEFMASLVSHLHWSTHTCLM